jgi:heptosyltransferase-3
LSFNPQNILVIHFGQMGDVILALAAFQAIRQKFPDARITALIGKSSARITHLAGVFDEEIVVDRVELRDGNKLSSINKIRHLVKEIRRRKFDFIIDLHSLSETNLLGFLSGAEKRLYANRENRSLDFLAKFPEKPPAEDKSKHIADRYLDALKPLGIENVSRFAQLKPQAADVEFVINRLDEQSVATENLVGFFPGAGHPGRRWGLENFAALGRLLREAENPPQIVVFLGPEERDMRGDVERIFTEKTVIFDNLTIPQLLAALSLLRVLVSNDTGPMHLAAVAGAGVVMISDERAPTYFYPLAEKLEVVRNTKMHETSPEEVYRATRKLLNE